MISVTIREAEMNLSNLVALVQDGEKVLITRDGQPLADLIAHQPQKNKIKFGTAAGKLRYKDEDFVGLDPDIQEMFYGEDREEDQPTQP